MWQIIRNCTYARAAIYSLIVICRITGIGPNGRVVVNGRLMFNIVSTRSVPKYLSSFKRNILHTLVSNRFSLSARSGHVKQLRKAPKKCFAQDRVKNFVLMSPLKKNKNMEDNIYTGCFRSWSVPCNARYYTLFPRILVQIFLVKCLY
jgi:hypothetical protein